jgi:hypothetical protein
MDILHLGFVQRSVPSLCQIWWFVDFSLSSRCIIIMAFRSIERYFLIFHDRVFLNKNKRLIFHYITSLYFDFLHHSRILSMM